MADSAHGFRAVRVIGSGKGGHRLTNVSFSEPETLDIRVSGEGSHLRVQVVDASAGRSSELDAPEGIGDGAYRTKFRAPVERYRIRLTGQDNSGWPFQRMHPVLFRVPSP